MQIASFILILIFSFDAAIAQNEAGLEIGTVKSASEKIAQKIKMVNLILHSPDMLQRVEASDDSVARELLARAAENFLKGEEYFDQGNYLEAEAVLDFVLRDLSASAQLLSVPQQKRNQYLKFMEQLDAFALPEWNELNERENDFLESKLQRISELRKQASRQADAKLFDDAISSLKEAYGLKVTLIDTLKHETTIVYDLNFSTVEDEYQYMINRTYHYLDLVQLALSKNDIDEQTRRLTDTNVYVSMVNLEIAEDFESKGQFSEALPALDKAINQLTAVLKILGVKI